MQKEALLRGISHKFSEDLVHVQAFNEAILRVLALEATMQKPVFFLPSAATNASHGHGKVDFPIVSTCKIRPTFCKFPSNAVRMVQLTCLSLFFRTEARFWKIRPRAQHDANNTPRASLLG